MYRENRKILVRVYNNSDGKVLLKDEYKKF